MGLGDTSSQFSRTSKIATTACAESLCEIALGLEMRLVGRNCSQASSSIKVSNSIRFIQLLSTISLSDREITRKKYILSLENRTPDQIAEEEALYVEVKRLEHNERKFKKDRENLLRILAGIDSGLPDVVEDDGGPLGVLADGVGLSAGGAGSSRKKTTKKGTQAAADVETPSTPSVAGTPAIKRPNPVKNAAYGACLPFRATHSRLING